MGCTEKTTDTSEPSGEPAGEPGQEPGQEPAGEPNNPPVEDEDGDGFTRDDGDCDDNNPDVYPGAEDIPGNGIDEDCSGTDAQDNGRILDDVFTGELIVTEVMNTPVRWVMMSESGLRSSTIPIVRSILRDWLYLMRVMMLSPSMR